jgi:hypothetical protein
MRKCLVCDVIHGGIKCPKCHAKTIDKKQIKKTNEQEIIKLPFGPGTELSEIIPAIFKGDQCDCKSYASKMDRWGVDGCEHRFEAIVGHLVKQASKIPIICMFSPVNEIIARRWLRQAIDNCKQARPVKDNGDWLVAVTKAPSKG